MTPGSAKASDANWEQSEGVSQSCKSAAGESEESKERLIKALVCPLPV